MGKQWLIIFQIPLGQITSQATFIIWPPSRWKKLYDTDYVENNTRVVVADSLKDISRQTDTHICSRNDEKDV